MAVAKARYTIGIIAGSLLVAFLAWNFLLDRKTKDNLLGAADIIGDRIVDASGVYKVQVLSAHMSKPDFSKNDETGLLADPAPELFVYVTQNGANRFNTNLDAKGMAVKDSFDPTWVNVEFTIDWKRGDKIEVFLLEKDPLKSETVFGMEFDPQIFPFDKDVQSDTGSYVKFGAARVD